MGAVTNDHREDFAPYVFGSTLAAVTLPALVLGLSAPLWVGVTIALAVLAGAIAWARWRTARTRADTTGPSLRSTFVDATATVGRLVAAANAIGARPVRNQARRIGNAADLILAGIADDPSTLAHVQRVLSYYLPSAATLVESYRVLELRGDSARLDALAAVIGRLDTAFQHYADRLAEDALKALDVEIRLVDAALKDDLGDTSLR